MMWLGWVAMASAATVGTDEGQVWMLPGTVDCDAREVLARALEDEVLEVFEAHRVGSCDHVTPLTQGLFDAHRVTQAAIAEHQDDPQALAVVGLAVSTLRHGLLGDAVRMSLQLEIAQLLEGAEPGPWQDVMRQVVGREPGPRPVEDLPVFAAMLREGVMDGPTADGWWHWGQMSLHSGVYLAALPLLEPLVADLQRAVDAPDPRSAVDQVDEDWRGSWRPSLGYVYAVRNLVEMEEELDEAWSRLPKASEDVLPWM